MDDVRATGVRTPLLVAFEATLDSLTLNSQASLEKFKQVASETAKGSRRNTRYIHEYSLYQIAMIEGDMLTAEKHRITAKRIGASRFYTEERPIMDQSVLTLP